MHHGPNTIYGCMIIPRSKKIPCNGSITHNKGGRPWLYVYIYTPTYLHTCILATFSTTYSTYLLIDYILLLIECCYKYIQIHRHNRHVLHTLPAPTTYFCSYFTSSVIQFFLEHHYPRHHVTRIGCLGAPGTYNNKNNKNKTTNGNNNKTYIYLVGGFTHLEK